MPYTLLRITDWKMWYNELEVKDVPSKGALAFALCACFGLFKLTTFPTNARARVAVILVTACEALSMSPPDAPEFRGWDKRPWSPLCNVRMRALTRTLLFAHMRFE